MRLLLCLAVLIAAANARPEPPVGYNYPSPSNLQFGNGLESSQLLFGGQSGKPSLGALIAQGGEGISPSSDFGAISSGPSHGFSSGSFGGYPSGPSVITSGPSLVHKHVYVHVAPEEHEEHRPQKPIVLGAPQKHYKIIFIKAPAPPKPVAPIIPAQPQNEEKTLVYVLVKKPEEAPEISIPTPIPTQPSKPEVYFIKYNTKKEHAGGYDGPSIGHSLEQNLGGASIGQSLGGTSIGQSLGGHSNGHSLAGSSIEQSLAGSSSGQSLSHLGINAGVSSSSAGVSNKYGPPGYQS